jgi:acyl-CoA thioesterase FadM
MYEAIYLMVVNISIEYHSSMHVGDMLQAKSRYFIIFSDLDLA